jgi:hypothetical protein
MSPRDDLRAVDGLERVVEDWMVAEDVAGAPDRLYEAVFARTSRIGQARRRPWPALGRSAWAVAAVVVAGTVAIVALLLATGVPRPPAVAGPGPAATATPAATVLPGGIPPSATPAVELVREPVCAEPSALVAAGVDAPGGLWLTCTDGARWVTLPDATAVSPAIGGVGLVASDGADTWAMTADGIVRLGPPGVRIGATVPVPGATALAVGSGAVWVATRDGTLVRVDPSTGRTTARVAVGSRPVAVLAAAGSVWVAARGDGMVVRVDPRTAAVIERIPAGVGPSALAAGAGAVWAASPTDGVVTRIDTGTAAIRRVSAPLPDDKGGISGLAASQEAVYIAVRETLFRLDPATGLAIASVRLSGYPAAMAVDGRDPWIAFERDLRTSVGALVRLRVP